MRYAVLNKTGAVSEVVEFPDDLKIGRDIIHPDLAHLYVPIHDEPVALGAIRDGVGWRAPEPPPVDLAAYAAAARWRFETGGVDVGGVRAPTDRASQQMIAGMLATAQLDAQAVIKFKAASGFVALDAAQTIALARAVGAHVQAAFAREADVAERIASGEVTTTAQIDAAFAGAD